MTSQSLTGGPLRAAISNEIGHLLYRYTGHGPTQARTVVQGDLVLCLLEVTLSKGERSLLGAGHDGVVLNTRALFQDAMRDDLIEVVERLTGRTVIVFMSQNHLNPEVAAEVFVLEPQPAVASAA